MQESGQLYGRALPSRRTPTTTMRSSTKGESVCDAPFADRGQFCREVSTAQITKVFVSRLERAPEAAKALQWEPQQKKVGAVFVDTPVPHFAEGIQEIQRGTSTLQVTTQERDQHDFVVAGRSARSHFGAER